jgi:hypothetical protein
MITILDSTIEVLEMLLVLDLSIPFVLCVALWSLSLPHSLEKLHQR